MHIRGAIGSQGAVHRTVGNLRSHPADASCGTIHYDASTVAGMSGCAVAARVRGQHVVVGIHLGTWACQDGHLNVAAGYHALQRLRRACGNAKSLSSPGALEYLKRKVRKEIFCGETEPPLPSELQSTISDSDYEDEEVLIQAKRGAARKAAHRSAVATGKAYENDPEDEARHQASLEFAAEKPGFYTAGSSRSKPAFGPGPSMLHYQPPSGKRWADMSADSDDDDGFYEAPKKSNKIAVVIDDPTLGAAKPKVEAVATFLLETQHGRSIST